MKEKGILFSSSMLDAIACGDKRVTRRVVFPQPAEQPDQPVLYTKEHCPFWGVRLWAKEKLYMDDTGCARYARGHACVWVSRGLTPHTVPLMWASNWKRNYLSPIHMPREAARLFLDVIACRLERLHQITEEEATLEGVDSRAAFAMLWDSLNAKRGYSWDANPWVWRIQFEEFSRSFEQRMR